MLLTSGVSVWAQTPIAVQINGGTATTHSALLRPGKDTEAIQVRAGKPGLFH